jgi:hypothetical protein
MRRLTPRYKNWLLHRARRESGMRFRATGWTFAVVASRDGARLAHVRPAKMPSLLCLDRAYEPTISFVTEMRVRTSRALSPAVRAHMRRHSGRIGWLRNYQDFSSLQKITPGAALLVAAEYDGARRLAGGPLHVVDLEHWNPSVYAVLRALGFFELLDLPRVPVLRPKLNFHQQCKLRWMLCRRPGCTT